MSKRFIGVFTGAAVAAIAMSGVAVAEEKPIIIGIATAHTGWFAIQDEGGVKAAELSNSR